MAEERDQAVAGLRDVAGLELGAVGERSGQMGRIVLDLDPGDLAGPDVVGELVVAQGLTARAAMNDLARVAVAMPMGRRV